MLSGFVMCHAYCDTDFTKRENIFNYYLKRIAKIYPTYLVVTLVYSSFVMCIRCRVWFCLYTLSGVALFVYAIECCTVCIVIRCRVLYWLYTLSCVLLFV